MKYTLHAQPDFGMAEIEFEQPQEQLVVESGAMVARDSSMTMKTSMGGGLMAAAKRKMLGGESLFLNTFTSTRAGERLFVAPSMEGDIKVIEMTADEPLMLQSGAFVASAPGVEMDTKWGGLKGFASGHGLFFLKATGVGPLFINSYGAMHEIVLDGTNNYIVDNDHIIAFTEGVDFQVRRLGGLKSVFLSGEGYVCEFSGRGRVWMQTRSQGAFAAWIDGFRRVKSSSN